MDQNVPFLAVDLHAVDKDHLVDAVIVPLVVRRHLVEPLGHTGVGVTCENGHGIFVVAGPLDRIPGRGVAGAVVDQVELRVVGIPSPRRAAAGLPLLAFPRFEAGIGANRLAQFRRLFRIDQYVGIGAGGIGPPGQRPVFQVEGRERAMHAEFGAGNADENLVLDHDGRRRAGFALAAVGVLAVLDLPDLLAGRGIDRHDVGVRLVEQDQSRMVVAFGRIGDAAVDGVAAHDGNDVRILLGLVFPQDLAVVLQIERIDDVRERRVQVHHVADDQRAAFMAAQHAGREAPFDLQVLHIVLVDLVKRRIALVRVVAGLHDPIARIFAHLRQVVVGEGKACHAERQNRRGCQNLGGFG